MIRKGILDYENEQLEIENYIESVEFQKSEDIDINNKIIFITNKQQEIIAEVPSVYVKTAILNTDEGLEVTNVSLGIESTFVIDRLNIDTLVKDDIYITKSDTNVVKLHWKNYLNTEFSVILPIPPQQVISNLVKDDIQVETDPETGSITLKWTNVENQEFSALIYTPEIPQDLSNLVEADSIELITNDPTGIT
jgi:hypothetical protein